MNRRRISVLLGILVLALGTVPGPTVASAQGITVVESAASHTFAQQVTFTLKATSEAKITTVYLFFQAAGDEHTESVNVPIEQGNEVNVSYVHELRRTPLPPFATVDFWWQIEDGAGHRAKTAPQQFPYADNRFRWDEVRAEGITVHWIEGQGDPAFGQTALDIARASVAEINAELRAPIPPSIDIYIYDAQHNLDTAMVLTGRDWVSGQAHPELGVVLVAISPEDGHRSHMMRVLPHEITHLLVYQAVTPDGYRYVPEWLDEGLATANERLPTPEHAVAIEEARDQGDLLPLQDLCVPFSPDPQTALLAYAESGSVVRFVRERYGAQGIRALLAAYGDGASCGGGIQEALDVSFNGLETAWRTSLEPQAPWRGLIGQIGAWVGLWLLSLLVAIPMIGGLRRR
jgi:hypothetical protein